MNCTAYQHCIASNLMLFRAIVPNAMLFNEWWNVVIYNGVQCHGAQWHAVQCNGVWKLDGLTHLSRSLTSPWTSLLRAHYTAHCTLCTAQVSWQLYHPPVQWCTIYMKIEGFSKGKYAEVFHCLVRFSKPTQLLKWVREPDYALISVREMVGFKTWLCTWHQHSSSYLWIDGWAALLFNNPFPADGAQHIKWSHSSAFNCISYFSLYTSHSTSANRQQIKTARWYRSSSGTFGYSCFLILLKVRHPL